MNQASGQRLYKTILLNPSRGVRTMEKEEGRCVSLERDQDHHQTEAEGPSGSLF